MRRSGLGCAILAVLSAYPALADVWPSHWTLSRSCDDVGNTRRFASLVGVYAVEWNRSRFLMIGMLCLLFGAHFRLVESVVLTKQVTQFLAEKMSDEQFAANGATTWLASRGPIANKTLTPPTWLGWSLLSVGSVITLHSLVMRKQV